MTRPRSPNPEPPPPADTGCVHHPACLSCPEERCIIYERPEATGTLRARIREEHTAQPALSYAGLAIRLGCSAPQVRRALTGDR